MENTVCSAYSGLVPMSPNTIPSAASASARSPTGGSAAVAPAGSPTGSAVADGGWESVIGASPGHLRGRLTDRRRSPHPPTDSPVAAGEGTHLPGILYQLGGRKATANSPSPSTTGTVEDEALFHRNIYY